LLPLHQLPLQCWLCRSRLQRKSLSSTSHLSLLLRLLSLLTKCPFELRNYLLLFGNPLLRFALCCSRPIQISPRRYLHLTTTCIDGCQLSLSSTWVRHTRTTFSDPRLASSRRRGSVEGLLLTERSVELGSGVVVSMVAMSHTRLSAVAERGTPLTNVVPSALSHTSCTVECAIVCRVMSCEQRSACASPSPLFW